MWGIENLQKNNQG